MISPGTGPVVVNGMPTNPGPNVLRDLTLDLPGRKPEYLHAVSEAALDG